MGEIIGIDLGTTYSCIAIPEERAGEGFRKNRKCPGYSVILDPQKRSTFPSVVAENEKGEVVIGYTAKGRAGLSPEPIMFSKRYMGEEKTFQLNQQGTLKPEDVAAHILRFLKKNAEQRLGTSVDDAVITIPAYFSMSAKQMTEKAGEMAGLNVVQIVQEPVAAALMYCLSDKRENLKILTYDLGGGTFDVALLEKKEGTISTNSILAFDGNRFLGGFDFDQKIAFWIIKELNSMGYDIDFDDSVSFSKFLIYAERAKIALSSREKYDFMERNTGIIDKQGKPVSIQISMTRGQFESLIRKDVDYTIDKCKQTITEKTDSKVDIKEIDEIIMVGGSSRITLISKRLEEEFGKKPKLIDPDLCVAIGAAIIASTKAKSFGCLKLDNIPNETCLPHLSISGSVQPGNKISNNTAWTVSLNATDFSYQSKRNVNENGGFFFDQVTLNPEDKTEFVMKVFSSDGTEVEKHCFSVIQTQNPSGGSLIEASTNVLSKPISVLLVNGIQEVVPARTPLPHETLLHAKTMDTSGEIRVPVYEGNNPIGEIIMADIPDNIHVGTDVEITLSLQENYQINGRAYIPKISQEKTVVIDIPIPPAKSMQELKSEFEDLIIKADESKSSVGRGALFSDGRIIRLNERIETCEELFDSPAPDTHKIQDIIHEIESLIRDISSGWRPEPPRAIFNQKLKNAEKKYQQLINKRPEIKKDGYDKSLNVIQQNGEKAYVDQNPAAWKDAYNKLNKLFDELESLLQDGEGGCDGPHEDPNKILMSVKKELDDLEIRAREEGKYPEYENEFQALNDSLEKIDPKAQDAMGQIRDWYFTKYANLKNMLNAPKKNQTGLVGRK